MSQIIETRDLCKVYESGGFECKALDNLNLQIESNRFVAIMGPSGSGKTTLLNVLSTIDLPTSGSVWIDGKEMSKMNEKQLSKFRGETIGFVFQEFNLLDNMSIRNNIALPLTLNGEKVNKIVEKTEKLARLLGIEKQLDKYPYELSGGQRQRAAVCRALMINPKILFADEPTRALDSRATTELLQCFKEVKKTYGTTIMMVTHDAGAASYADEVIFIKDGKLNGKLENSENRKEAFDRILHMVAVLGGDTNAGI